MNPSKLFRRYSSADLVLIYQFGKVGSTTLAASIPGAVNVHDLFANPLCPCGFRYRLPAAYRWFGYPLDRFCRRAIIRRRKSIDIIVPVRPPWERNISMFFQDLPFWYVEYFAKSDAIQKVEGIGLIQQAFTTMFDHAATEHWFEKEFCRFTGVAFDDIPFDKSAGYSIMKKGKYRCLFLTTDHVRSDDGRATISSFLDREIVLSDQNRGSKKWYGPVYEQFLADKEFVEEYKNQLSSSPVQKKFFS